MKMSGRRRAERVRPVSPVPVGLDVGTGLVKAVTPTKRVSFPSVVGASTDLWWRTLSRGTLLDNLSVIDREGEEWFAGDLAIKESPVTYYAVRKGRYLDTRVMSLLIDTALGLVCPEVSGQPVNLVVGVPAETAPNTIEELTELTRGRHEILLTNKTSPEDRKSASVFVERIKVVPSTLGSLIKVDHEIRAKEADYEPFTGFVIDVGQGTTSYLAVEKMRTVHGSSVAHRVAVDSVLDHIRKFVVHKTGDLIDRDELSTALFHDKITVGGSMLDVRKVREDASERIAQHVFLKVRELVHLLPAGSHVVDKRYGKFIITGGGAYLVGSILERLLAPINKRIVSLEDPVFANAEGLLIANQIIA